MDIVIREFKEENESRFTGDEKDKSEGNIKPTYETELAPSELKCHASKLCKKSSWLLHLVCNN